MGGLVRCAWMAALVALAFPTVVALAPAGAGDATGGAEAGLASRLNADRGAAGLPALALEDDLVAVARRHSEQMVSRNRLFHNPALAEQVEDWKVLGENVGKGPGVEEVHRAFMASDVHRARIVDQRFTGVGVGVVHSGGELWVTQVFRQRLEPTGTAADSRPTPAPAPPASHTGEGGAGAAVVTAGPGAGAPTVAPGRSTAGRGAPAGSAAAPTTTVPIPAVAPIPGRADVTFAGDATSAGEVTSALATASAAGRRPVVAAPVESAATLTVTFPEVAGTTAAGRAAAALLWAVVAATLGMSMRRRNGSAPRPAHVHARRG